MPKAEELPESLRRLADFKAVDGSHERFSEAVESLVAMAPRGVAVDTGVARPRAVLPDLMLSLPVLLGLACAVVGILELRAFDLVGLADELRPLSSGLAICGLGAIAMHLAVLGPRPGLLLSGGLVATLGLSLASMFAGWWLMGTMEDTRSHVLAALPGALAGSAAVAACWLDARS
jgi:hypothetical protein